MSLSHSLLSLYVGEGKEDYLTRLLSMAVIPGQHIKSISMSAISFNKLSK